MQIHSSVTIQIKKQCPLNGQCLTESIFYQANITANISDYKETIYLGVSQVRYGNHKKSFIKRPKNDTELSKEYWKVKQQNGINTHNKVESIKEMIRLQSRAKTTYLTSK